MKIVTLRISAGIVVPMTMFKKPFSLVVLSAVLTITGCTTVGTAEKPADATTGGWSEGYVTLSSGMNLLCVWNQKNSNFGTVDCDWDRPIPAEDLQDGVDHYFVGEGGWSEEYVKLHDGRILLCVWGNRSSETAVRSCGWNR